MIYCGPAHCVALFNRSWWKRTRTINLVHRLRSWDWHCCWRVNSCPRPLYYLIHMLPCLRISQFMLPLRSCTLPFRYWFCHSSAFGLRSFVRYLWLAVGSRRPFAAGCVQSFVSLTRVSSAPRTGSNQDLPSFFLILQRFGRPLN